MSDSERDDPGETANEEQLATLVAACIEAIERGEPDPVERVCERAPHLRSEVSQRLKRLASRGLMPGDAGLPRAIGPFRILGELGRGGMGEVYIAEQQTPVRRQVALKVVKLGMDTREVLTRFQAERQALALMNHPGIARVHEAGATPEGRPYFAMEYVKGVPITTYCDQQKLSIARRLELFREVCAAVQHAHTKGVLHRDLKPSNILITLQDGRPQPKIIDFGLAKAIDHRLVETTLHTQIGAVMGTPEYMSPEQAGVDALDVDTRTDVYSLGVILFELLTGELPFDSERLRKGGPEQMQRILRETDAPRPSSKVSTSHKSDPAAALRRGAAPTELRNRLRGDLDWIVLKALEKDRTRRYETAHELSADVERHLHHEPVRARPQSAGYQLAKFVRRNRVQCAAGVLFVATLIAGVVATYRQYLRAELKAEEASRNEVAARDSQRRADEKAAEALARKAEFDQLAGVVLHARAAAGERELFPPWPAQIPAMTAWLSSCDELLAMRPQLAQTVRDLRARARPANATEAAAAPAAADAEAALHFDLPAQRFLHDTLRELERDLEELARVQRPSVERRLRWARQIEELTLRHPNARATWQQARAAIAAADGVQAHERYAEQPIDLAPQLGLVPIGMNPVTKLWEFYELRSAWDGEADPHTLPIPQHDARGNVAVGDDTGIVFVLLPGGRFLMGAQKDDPDAPNHDPQVERDEMPHRMTLAPFFLARHELTQGQWLRLSDGEEPSAFRPGEEHHGVPVTLAFPVEQVDWQRTHDLLARHGLLIPTEAQWEYGCRAGTTTPWYPGTDPALLAEHANLADATLKGLTRDACEEWRDGFAFTAPVGAFPANGFGLHDMHGNLWEWCRDRYGPFAEMLVPGDGENLSPERTTDRTARGGAYQTTSIFARSANRNRPAPGFRTQYLGCRASRSVGVGVLGGDAR